MSDHKRAIFTGENNLIFDDRLTDEHFCEASGSFGETLNTALTVEFRPMKGGSLKMLALPRIEYQDVGFHITGYSPGVPGSKLTAPYGGSRCTASSTRTALPSPCRVVTSRTLYAP